MVTQVHATHEGATFASDVHLIADGTLPGETVETAQVSVTRVDPETYVPPLPDTAVNVADAAQRDAALYFARWSRKLPIGLGRDGRPVFANFD
jgi:hypothetical protein